MVKIVISMQDGIVNSVVSNQSIEVIVRSPLGTKDLSFAHQELVAKGADGEDYSMYRCKPWVNERGVEYMYTDMAKAEYALKKKEGVL